MPNIEHWADTLDGSYIVINEAKLILPASDILTDSLFRLPSNFILLGFNADSTTYLLPDYYEGTSYFGGSYNSTEQAVIFPLPSMLMMLGSLLE